MGFYRSILVLTGAGISAESGLGTFRDKDGLWTKYDLSEVATPEGFARNPAFVHEFYNARRRNLLGAEPNDAHRALAEFERGFGGEFLVVTQNVDDLHERAGSANLLHMHGELFKIRCEQCGAVQAHTGDLDLASACPACGSAGRLRPHVVWFGEMPLHMEEIDAALGRCDLFIAIGTSGNVYPAAGFIADLRRRRRAHTVELNLEPSETNALFHEHRFGPASRVVPEFLAELAQGL